jgi:deoxyribodipyrimidine photo-lyase
VHDQPALSAAARAFDEVVPLFVLDDALLRSSGANRRAFLTQSLHDLRDSLRRLDGDLIIRRGHPVEEALRIAHEVDATAVFVGADASAYAQRREARFACERIDLRIEGTIAAVPAGELSPAGRDHYRVFTPYWRRWRETPLPAVLPAPRRLTLPRGVEPGGLPSFDPPGTLPEGGERAGRRRLAHWLRHGLEAYDSGRNDLAADGTSRLSPYLHFGCVSAVEVIARAREHGPSAEPFVRQLCWRDFYHQLLAANPSLPTTDLNPRGDHWDGGAEHFERWRAGQTGFPIVDAGMRQLQSEGWMHNRARLLAASFLTKTLGVDWRAGEAVFSELLVDGDVGNNAGNWQWVAGTGVDTRPNRVFNPSAQARRLDSEGEYVRRYVPELDDPTYPRPIVDYADATARFKARRRLRSPRRALGSP